LHQRGAKAAYQGDCAGAGILEPKPGLVYAVGVDGAVDDPEHRAHGVLIGGRQDTQGKVDADDPLKQRDLGQDLVGTKCGGFRHAPGAATGAEATSFATKAGYYCAIS